MRDLISRKDVVDALKQRLEDDYIDSYELLKYIKDLPSVEPKRKKGEWIYDTERIWKNGGIYTKYHCSECNFQIIGNLYNFCSNCGADMRGE